MRRLATIVLVLGSITGVIHAETHAVLPGGSVQEKIDVAVDGDIVAIFGGTYNQDLTITKRIRLVEINGQDVIITGAVTFTSVADCPPFEGFTVGSNGNKNIVVNDCTGLVISGIDHTAGGAIEVNDSEINITDSALRNFIHNDGVTALSSSSLTGKIDQNGGELNVSDVTIATNFDTGNDAAKTVAFRTTVTEDCNWRSKLSWFGYGKARSFDFYGSDAKVVFVGSEIDALGEERAGMNLKGSKNNYLITNSFLHGTGHSYNDDNDHDNNIEFKEPGSTIVIQNNYFEIGGRTSPRGSYHIRIEESAGNATVRNNCFHSNYSAVLAGFGATIQNNHGNSNFSGGAAPLNTTTGDPLFVDGDPYQLAEGSPLINAGTEDPRYNDRDGSRNNIGPSGGSWYDPEGWTTEKPVVISFDLLPDSVLEGVDTEVAIEGVRAVSKP